MSTLQHIRTFVDDQQCLVCITMSDGSFGWGATAPFDSDVTAILLHRHLAPILLGQSPLDHDILIDRAWRKGYKFVGSHLARALGGLDAALWDWRGRLEGKAVCELLGSTVKPVRAYASSMRRDNSADDELDRLRRAIDRSGYDAIKVKVGHRLGQEHALNKELAVSRTDVLIDSLARHFVPAGIACFADANGCFDSVADALDMSTRLGHAGFVHFEEPCPYWDIESAARVTQASPIPTAGGEQDFCPQQFKRIIDQRAFNILQPDVGYCGGFTRALRVARTAITAGMSVLPHSSNFSPMLLYAAHLQLALKQPQARVETTIDLSPWCENTYEPMPFVRDGHLHIPEGPGWGITPTARWKGQARCSESTTTSTSAGQRPD
jgi:L-alanine-DL-glutamate epimerase-like enolase superfamily enzyme